MENKNNHPYNQVYSYEAILEEVKELILPTILRKIPFYNCFIVFGQMNKEEYAELIFNDILALVSNGLDVETFVKESTDKNKKVISPGHTKYNDIALFLYGIIDDYKHQVNALKVFYQMTQDLMPHSEVMENVKKELEPLKYEEYYEDYTDMYKKVWIKSEMLKLHYTIKNKEFQNANIEEMENMLKNIIRQINNPDSDINYLFRFPFVYKQYSESLK